jgi:SAM-dependent methyltransferase
MFSSADAYERFVGRYGASLARALLEAAGVGPSDSVLDVGCGTGALTATLADVVDAGNVAAVEPSGSFAATCAQRVPDADVRVGSAEALPDFGRHFDVVLSQLVVNFMADADAGVRAMRGATRSGGTVASCVWDYAEGMTLLRLFWDAALELDPQAPDEATTMPHCTPDALRRLWERCGLRDVQTDALHATADYVDFDDLWTPILGGVGPAGAFCASLPPDRQKALKDGLWSRLGSPSGRFTLRARAWFVRGIA